MTTIYRPKSYPEVLDNMLARFRKLEGLGSDFNIGAWIYSIFQSTGMSVAEVHVQMSKIPKLFSLRGCKGDDIDARARDLGTFFRRDLRRLAARESTAKVVFGDGTLLVSGRLAADIAKSATTFSLGVGESDVFPSAGAVEMERGTVRAERISYTRSGDVFTRVSPVASFLFPHAAFGEVARIATQSALVSAILVGGVSAVLQPGTGASWPSTGTVILDRGTLVAESRAFTKAGDTLTLALGTTFAHAIEGSAILSTFGSDRNINAGTQIYVPETESSKRVTFETRTLAVLRDGDFWSAVVDAICLAVGVDTNVGSGTISRIASSPFAGAVVSNPLPAGGGRNREEDDDYITRLENFVASHGGRTARAIETHVVRLFDAVSNSRVAFAQVVEPVLPTGTSLLYITDGSTGFVIEREVFLGRDVLVSNATSGDRRGKLHAAAPFLKQAQPEASRTPRIYASVNRGVSTSVGVNFLEDTTQNMVVNVYTGMYLKTADDQFYAIVSNTAIRFVVSAGGGVPTSGAYAVLDFGAAFISSASTGVSVNTLTDTTQLMTVNVHAGRILVDAAGVVWDIISNTATAFTLDADGEIPTAGVYKVYFSRRSLPLIPDVDFNINESTGDFEIGEADALLAHDAIVAASDGASPSVGAYTFSKGLGALVQRAVNGDPTDFADFPGVRSHGVKVLVVVPTIIIPSFQIAIIPKSGASKEQLVALVKQVVQSYVNGGGIGDEVILTEVNKLVKSLRGVSDLVLISPSSNVAVADGQMARVAAADVAVF